MRLTTAFILAVAIYGQERGRGVNFYSIEKEKALGAQLAAGYQRSSVPIDSPELLARVDALGKSLVPADTKFSYTFAVVSDKGLQLNEPAAFPGGFIYVPSGLIESARNVDEFAGMLAHAIAHIEDRHGTKQATKGELVNQAAMPLIYMGGWAGYSMRQNASLSVPLGMLKFMRASELQADTSGGKLMSAAGYNPERFADYIEREQQTDPGNRFSVQPPRSERVAALRALPSPTTAPASPPDLVEMQELLHRAAPEKPKEPPRLAR